MADYVDLENGHTRESNLNISTFVFLDFEATGLTKSRITELCLLAVNKIDLCPNNFPRIINKLVLCVDPKKPIDMFASQITGLYNDNLEYQKPFSEDTVNLINNFLSHLAAPICIVAHNGNGFDFPLLLSELQRVSKTLTDGLYCADSLEGFRELDGLPRKFVRQPHINTTPNSKVGGADNSVNSGTPPTKITELSNPPPVKRKSADNLALCNAKLVKRDVEISEISGVAVKKRLDFEEKEEADDGDTAEPAASQTRLFSESLDDSDYLMALDMAEKEHKINTNNDVKIDANKNNSATSPSCPQNQNKSADNQNETTADSAMETESYAKETNKCTEDVKAESADCGMEVEDCTNEQNNFFTNGKVTFHDAVAACSGYMVRVKQDILETHVTVSQQTDTSTIKAPVESFKNRTNNITDKPNIGIDGANVCLTTSSMHNVASSAESVEAPVQRTGASTLSKEGDTCNKNEGIITERNVNNVDNDNTCVGSRKSIETLSATSNSCDGNVQCFQGVDNGNLSAESTSNPKHIKSAPSAENRIESNNCVSTGAFGNFVTPMPNLNIPPAIASTSYSSPVKRKSYKLEEIYLRTFQSRPEITHCAEADCVMLMKISSKCPQFIDWMDKNAVPLSSVKAD